MSVTFMQKNLMPDWMQTVSDYNPLNWAVEAGRDAVTAYPDWGAIAGKSGLLVGLPVRLRPLRDAGVPHLPAGGLSAALPGAQLRRSAGGDVGLREVLADEEQRLAGEPGGRVGHAVAVVEAGRMAPLAEAEEGVGGELASACRRRG